VVLSLRLGNVLPQVLEQLVDVHLLDVSLRTSARGLSRSGGRGGRGEGDLGGVVGLEVSGEGGGDGGWGGRRSRRGEPLGGGEVGGGVLLVEGGGRGETRRGQRARSSLG
jgi:hypothetical protein